MGGGLHFGVASKSAKWHSEPDGRGAYGLVSSCLITMALCIWTAVHLNLPEHKKPNMQTWRKVRWLVLGLFAPELVAWTAFEQYREASANYKRIKQVLGEEVPSPLPRRICFWRRCKSAVDLELNLKTPAHPKRHPWTMTHSYYATMGGFAFDTEVMKQDILPGGRKRVALTSRGVLNLATITQHLLPNLSASQIKDKSKANHLAKMIVCLQAFYLAVSLLELNTFAHAICALLAYFLWWSKPFDVEEPSIIEGADVAIVCAGMCMRSSLGTRCVAEGFFADSRIEAWLWRENEGTTDTRSRVEFGLLESMLNGTQSDQPVYAETAPEEDETQIPRAEELLTISTKGGESAALGAFDNLEERHTRLYMGQSLHGFGFRRGPYDKFPESSGGLLAQRTGFYLANAHSSDSHRATLYV